MSDFCWQGADTMPSTQIWGSCVPASTLAGTLMSSILDFPLKGFDSRGRRTMMVDSSADMIGLHAALIFSMRSLLFSGHEFAFTPTASPQQQIIS
jgi:hypothetical protein